MLRKTEHRVRMDHRQNETLLDLAFYALIAITTLALMICGQAPNDNKLASGIILFFFSGTAALAQLSNFLWTQFRR